jgi:hypothetical protein
MASLAGHIWKTRACVKKGRAEAVNNLMRHGIPQ